MLIANCDASCGLLTAYCGLPTWFLPLQLCKSSILPHFRDGLPHFRDGSPHFREGLPHFREAYVIHSFINQQQKIRDSLKRDKLLGLTLTFLY